MATEDSATYPKIPVKHWWTLREKFKQSIPSAVKPGYLAAALGMQEKSARANIMPALVTFKIIDADGKPQDRAVRWRDDGQYPQVCEEIRKEIYPQELLDALPGPLPDREAVERWFANKTGAGEVGVKMMALVYLLLSEADPSKQPESSASPPAARRKTKRTSKPKASSSKDEDTEAPLSPPKKLPPRQVQPSLHIDVQVHISPDASAEQIDQIFASMAKHLYKNVS
jgi:hypothetical protein